MKLLLVLSLPMRLRPTSAAVQFGIVRLVSRLIARCGIGAQLEPLNNLPSAAHEAPATTWLLSDEISRSCATAAVDVVSRPASRLVKMRVIDWLSTALSAAFLADIVVSEVPTAVEIDHSSVLASAAISMRVEVEISAATVAVCVKVANSSEVIEPVSVCLFER